MKKRKPKRRPEKLRSIDSLLSKSDAVFSKYVDSVCSSKIILQSDSFVKSINSDNSNLVINEEDAQELSYSFLNYVLQKIDNSLFCIKNCHASSQSITNTVFITGTLIRIVMECCARAAALLEPEITNSERILRWVHFLKQDNEYKNQDIKIYESYLIKESCFPQSILPTLSDKIESNLNFMRDFIQHIDYIEKK